MKIFVIAIFGLLAVGLLSIIGCETPSAPAASNSESLPADLFVTTAPPDAIDVAAARKSAIEGQPISIKGRVGGQKEPLAANRAIVTLSDLNLRTCDKSPMKTCDTPWDSCCESPEQVAANTLSVQVLGPDHRPLKTGLASAGLAPMKQVIVSGLAHPKDGVLVIEAKQIYLIP